MLLALARIVENKPYETAESASLTYVILNVIIFLIPGFIYTRLRHEETAAQWRLRPFSGFHLFFLFVSSVAAFFGSLLLGILLARVFPESFAATAMTSSGFFVSDNSFFGVCRTLLAFALVPAVSEEFVFRSIVLHEYEKFGWLHASLVSALTFSMMHFNLVRFPIYFFCGLLLSLVAIATNSMIASSLVHFLFNAGIIFFESYVTHCVTTAQNGYILLLFIVIFLALISLFFVLACAQKIFRARSRTDFEIQKPEGTFLQNFITLITAPPMILFFVTFVIMTVINA